MSNDNENPTFKERFRAEILDKLSVRRLLVYCTGLFLIAVGISISAKSSLGVSPVNSVPYTVSLLTNIEQGMCTTVFFIFLILVQFLISPKDFSPFSFLQIICSFVFGWFVTLANLCTSFIPTPDEYIFKMLYIVISLFFVAMGVFLYINSDFLPLPGEGVMLTFSKRTKVPFHICKVGFDCTVVITAVLISLIARGELLGVREGTVIAAVFVGIIIKPISKLLLDRLKRFIEA
ncbi:MAG: YitT family protein [Oscillospiraceae bacterium]